MTDPEIIKFLAVEGMGWSYKAANYAWFDIDLEYIADGDWDPLTCGDHMLELIDAMIGDGWSYDLTGKPPLHCNPFTALFCKGYGRHDFCANTQCRAVCLAAVKALEAKENKDDN